LLPKKKDLGFFLFFSTFKSLVKDCELTLAPTTTLEEVTEQLANEFEVIKEAVR
jgi:molybdopterin converting factor small subunit